MSKHARKRFRPFTYRDLREIFATGLSATAVLGTVSAAIGFLVAPVWTLAAAALVAGAAALSAYLRNLADMDSASSEWIARSRPALLLSALGGTALFFITVLMIPLSGWSAWLALALPLAFAALVRAAFLTTESDYKILAGTGISCAAWLLCFPGWGPRLTFAAVAFMALGILAANHLWNRFRQGVLKGKVVWSEWLPSFGVPAAVFSTALLAAFALTPDQKPLWDPSRSRPAGGPPRFIVEWSGGKDRPDASLPGTSSPPESPGELPPGAVVVHPPSLENISALVQSAAALFSRRGLFVIAGAAAALLLGWFLWRFFKRKRWAGIAEAKLKEVIAAAQRLRREPDEPPEEPADPRAAVVFLYNELRKEFDRHGYKKQPHLTPWEYARYLAVRLAGDRESIETMTRLFEQARYSDERIDTASRREMTRLSSALRGRARSAGAAVSPAPPRPSAA